MGRAEMAQIVIEVAEPRRQRQSEDPGLACTLAETLDAMPAGGVRVGGDVEATAAGHAHRSILRSYVPFNIMQNVFSLAPRRKAGGESALRWPLGTKLCRPSEAVLDILPNPHIGPFTKEDGEVVIDNNGRRVR